MSPSVLRTLAGLIATLAALFSAHYAAKNLNHLGGTIWEAADGVMNAQINMQAQVIAANQLVSGAESMERLEYFSRQTGSELARAIGTGVFPAAELQKLQSTKARYTAAED